MLVNVSPDCHSNEEIIGYFSVRRRPSRQGIEAVTAVCQEMMRIEQQAGPREAPDASIKWLVDLLESKGTTYEEFIHTLGH